MTVFQGSPQVNAPPPTLDKFLFWQVILSPRSQPFLRPSRCTSITGDGAADCGKLTPDCSRVCVRVCGGAGGSKTAPLANRLVQALHGLSSGSSHGVGPRE